MSTVWGLLRFGFVSRLLCGLDGEELLEDIDYVEKPDDEDQTD